MEGGKEEQARELLQGLEAAVRTHALAEHNWHGFSACKRAVIGKRFNYIRNWLQDPPAIPPPTSESRPRGKRYSNSIWRENHRRRKRSVWFRPGLRRNSAYALKNLAPDPQYEPVMEEIRTALAAWQSQTGDKSDPANIRPDGGNRETFKNFGWKPAANQTDGE